MFGFAYYTKTPGTHQIINLEKDNAMRLQAVGIVYSEPGRYSVSTRPAKYEVALDNDRVRAWRLKLHAGETAPPIRRTTPGARIVVAGGTAEKRTGKPDQPMVLRNHDFMVVAVEERGMENIGNIRRHTTCALRGRNGGPSMRRSPPRADSGWSQALSTG